MCEILRIMREIGKANIHIKLKLFSMGENGLGMFNVQAWIPGKEGSGFCQDTDDPINTLLEIENGCRQRWPERFSGE